MAPEICPNCGEVVPPGAKACPECGSDERTGWSEAAAEGALGLPGQEFDYDDFVRREFGGGTPRPARLKWWWVAAAVLLLVVFGLAYFR